jgi:hypothetical protein
VTFVDQTWRRTQPMNVGIPVLTKSGEQAEDISLERRSPWRF